MKKFFVSILMIVLCVFCVSLIGCDSKDKVATPNDATKTDIVSTSTDSEKKDESGDYKILVYLSGKESHFSSEKKEDDFISYVTELVKDDNIVNTQMTKEDLEKYKTYFFASFEKNGKQYVVIHKSEDFYIIEDGVVHSVKEDFNAAYYLFLRNNNTDTVLATSTDGKQ